MINSTSRLLSRLCTSVSHVRRQSLSAVQEIGEIKEWLRQFSDGSVTCKPLNEGIVCIEWDHKRRLNAFTGSMAADFDDILCTLESNCPKGVILRGADGNFSSGSDLRFVEKIANREDGVKMAKFMQHLTERVLQLPAVSVALVEGVALGGGAELAMCTDFRVAVPNSVIGFKQSHMGLTTAWGGGRRLVSVVGRQTAMRLLLSGEDVNSTDALRLRLIDHLIPGERLQDGAGRAVVNNPLDEANKWLNKMIVKLPAEVVHAIKRLVLQASCQTRQDALETELAVVQSVWGKQAHLAALAARRNPCISTKT